MIKDIFCVAICLVEASQDWDKNMSDNLSFGSTTLTVPQVFNAKCAMTDKGRVLPSMSSQRAGFLTRVHVEHFGGDY